MAAECDRARNTEWSKTCPCPRCALLRAEHLARVAERERAKAVRPLLSDCPNVTRGTTFSLSCSCERCVLTRKETLARNAANAGQSGSKLCDWMVAERYRELERLGRTAQEIAWDLGVSKRTVERWRSKA